jgi:hypothetical protein
MKRAACLLIGLCLWPAAASACEYCKTKLSCQGTTCWETWYCGGPAVYSGWVVIAWLIQSTTYV